MKVENNEFVGSSNFMILHEELGLPFYIDVEEFTKGKYIMMSQVKTLRCSYQVQMDGNCQVGFLM